MPKHRLVPTILIASMLSLGACARSAPVATPTPAPPVVEASPPAPPTPDQPAAAAPAAASAALTEDELFARKTLEALNAEAPLHEVYFDLDQTGVRDDARSVLQRNADWLRRWPSTRVAAEGHGDARGTNEYNLALGDRRGQSVRDYLSSLGVDGGRMLVTSKGEEAPTCFDEAEDCWQRNRRVRFVITAK